MPAQFSQLTYEAGLLTANVRLQADSLERNYQLDQVAELAKLSICTVTENDDAISVTAETAGLSMADYNFRVDSRIGSYLNPLFAAMSYRNDKTDSVVDVDGYRLLGAVGVHPSFQTWLNDGGLTDDVREDALFAMLRLHGKNARKHLDDVGFMGIGIGLWPADFTLTDRQSSDLVTAKEGRFSLPTLAMQTIGNCACLGSSSSNRNIFKDDRTKLYDLTAHNLDTAHQTLSILVGIGSLAANVPLNAADTALSSAVWGQSRRSPEGC